LGNTALENQIKRQSNRRMLELLEISKRFDGVFAIKDVSFSISLGSITGLIGPNGAGKTTLFNVITGFLNPENGTVNFQNRPLTGLSPFKIALSGIGRTFQNLRIIKGLSVEENILLALSEGRVIRSIIKAFERRDSKVEEEKVKELLEVVGLSDKRYDLAGDLSYGQQKLLTIACCLALEPRLLLLDEPVAGIAPEMIEKILGIIKELPSKGKSVIMIEHNLDAIMQVCDRVIFMDAGKKICEGTPEEVRNDPRVIEAYID